MTSPTEQLARALAAPGRWEALEDLAVAAPAGLVDAVRDRWPGPPDRRDELAFLLSQCADPDVGPLAGALLAGSDGRVAGCLLGVIARTKTPLPDAELRRLLADGDGAVRRSAAGAAAALGAVGLVPAVRAGLAEAPDADVADLHRLLVALTGADPTRPDARGPEIRRAWAAYDPTPPVTRIRDARIADDRARFTVEGTGLVQIAFDPSGRSRSLRVAGRPAYDLGSVCDTCEMTLRRVGWPPRPAAAYAERLRDAVADVPVLTLELLDAVAPLAGALRSGSHTAVLLDLDLRRAGDRFRQRGTSGVVLPTQPLDRADPAAVDAHARAVAAGRRPTAVLMAWLDARREHTLVGAVLDGHHKLLAYAAAGVPARVLALFRHNDSWGPPDDRTQWTDAATEPFLVRGAR